MEAQSHKYARIERERRFLLDRLPPDLGAPQRIDDQYLNGTRFRLRRVTPPEPQPTSYKLTQKYQHHPDDLARVTITNTYLTLDETDTGRTGVCQRQGVAHVRATRLAWH